MATPKERYTMTEKARKEYASNPENWEGCMDDMINYFIAEEMDFKGQKFLKVSVLETDRDYASAFTTGKVEYKTTERIRGLYQFKTICGNACLCPISKTEMYGIMKEADKT